MFVRVGLSFCRLIVVDGILHMWGCIASATDCCKLIMSIESSYTDGRWRSAGESVGLGIGHPAERSARTHGLHLQPRLQPGQCTAGIRSVTHSHMAFFHTCTLQVSLFIYLLTLTDFMPCLRLQ